MSTVEIILIGLGLSMDAFAVAIGKGLSVPKTTIRQCLCVGLWFGGFQMLMPLLGYLLGYSFAELVASIDHWIAFVLLVLIGGNMIREALHPGDEDAEKNADFSFKTMFALALATAIDALAMGVNFAFLQVNIWKAIAIIGSITFVVSIVGLKIGNAVGAKFKTKAEIFGGIVLIALGCKTLIQHLFFQG